MSIVLQIPKPDPRGTVTAAQVWQLAQSVERLTFLVNQALQQLEQEMKILKEESTLGNHQS